MNQVLFAIPTNHETQLQLFWVRYSGIEIPSSDLMRLSPRLTDEVDQKLWVNPAEAEWGSLQFQSLQIIHFRTGVTDNPAHSFKELLEFESVFKTRQLEVHSGQAFLSNREPARVWNALIEESISFTTPGPKGKELVNKEFHSPSVQEIKVEEIKLRGMSPAELVSLSQSRFWALSETEMLVIQKHYGEKPITDVEIEVIAQTWSEHCKHKIFSANIDYEDENGKTRIESLFKTFIQKPTFDLQKKKAWAISVFKDNAGIVRFHEKVDLCIKVETHNSPSALDPYGGALTGILGVNRDILGTGLGAKPIANTNVLFFGNPKEEEALPEGLFHPKEILKGVHRGIQDGGNKSGIPTVNGAIIFDESFSGKPLVFCGTVGALPRKVGKYESASKNQKPGDAIVVIGGSVGLDGIHGATSSSLALDAKTPSSMVQIGDPLTQKRTGDFLLEARDLGLFNSVTDNGAGGLSSSIGEMAGETNGAKVYLDKVPLKYPGLLPWQIFVSESQERMTLSVPTGDLEALLTLAKKRGVQANHIGEFTASGDLEIFYQKERVGNLSLAFLHDGLPKMELKAKWEGSKPKKSWKKKHKAKEEFTTIQAALERLVADPSLASKEKWVRQYDHEVQAATACKPFEGYANSAPNEGGVIWMGAHGNPGFEGAVIGSGQASDFSHADTSLMAILATDEAVRNVLVTGADPDKVALIDNFCWPDPLPSAKNPDAEHKLAELVRTCRSLAEVVLAYEMPLVSGKDSMKNDFYGKNAEGESVKISVLPTLLVTALAHHPDVRRVLKPHAEPGSVLYVVGKDQQKDYFGFSLLKHFKLNSKNELNGWNPKHTREFYQRFFEATKKGLLASAHDISEGGALFALFESLLLNQAGAQISVPENEIPFLFNETPGRFLVSVSPDQVNAFESHFKADEIFRLGEVNPTQVISIKTAKTTEKLDLKSLEYLWRNTI